MWRRVLVVGIFVVFIFAIALMAHNDRKNSPIRKVQEEIERLKREGEPTSWQEIAPPVPKHLDGTPLYRKAFAQLEDAQRKFARQIWQTYNPKVVQAAKPALQTLRKALEFPHLRLIEKPEEIFLGQGVGQAFPFREFARLLRAEAIQQKRRGNLNGAVESCLTVLKLSRRIGDEAFLIRFLIQRLIFVIGTRALWDEILSDADTSATAYRAILTELKAWDIDRDFVRALKGERFVVNEMFEFWALRMSQKLRSRLDNFAVVGAVDFLLSPRNWFAENQLLMLEFYRQLISVAQKGVPYDRQQVSQLVAEFKRKCRKGWIVTLGKWKIAWRHYLFAETLIPIHDAIFDRVTDTHALQRVTMVALALRLYRKENGRYPENLQQLVPKFLPSVPVDPYDGKPIRYRKLEKGFKVWSVGGNRKDEGGIKVRDWWRRGDLVLESKI